MLCITEKYCFKLYLPLFSFRLLYYTYLFWFLTEMCWYHPSLHYTYCMPQQRVPPHVQMALYIGLSILNTTIINNQAALLN